jgi:hypothetical protein
MVSFGPVKAGNRLEIVFTNGPFGEPLYLLRTFRALLLGLVGQKTYAGGRAVKPNQLTASKCEPGRREDQEEFLCLQDIGRSLDFNPGPRRRHVVHQATAPPRPVNPHEIRRVGLLELHPIRFAVAPGHAISFPRSYRDTRHAGWLMTAAGQVMARYLPINEDSVMSANSMEPNFERLTKDDHDGFLI